jgi:MipA family protein
MIGLPVLTPPRIIACAAMLFSSSLAFAQSPASQPLWEIGVFGTGISQLAYPGADQQVQRALVLPTFIYRGKFIRADRDTAGVRAIKTSRFELDVGFAGSFGANSNDIDARAGMPDLGTLIEFGPRAKWLIGPGPGGGRWRAELPLRGVFDVSDRGAHKGMSLEPRVLFERQSNAGWRYSTSAGVIVADQRLARTFYEVRPEYALPTRPAYAAKSGLVAWRLSASVSKNLDPDWRLFIFGRVDHVGGAANENSPLVKKKTGASAGVGVAYTWKRSAALASD